jgi:hypothetical protein
MEANKTFNKCSSLFVFSNCQIGTFRSQQIVDDLFKKKKRKKLEKRNKSLRKLRKRKRRVGGVAYFVVDFQIRDSEEKFARWSYFDVRKDILDGQGDKTRILRSSHHCVSFTRRSLAFGGKKKAWK